jgi:uncharacterized protein (TIGR02444 family)
VTAKMTAEMLDVDAFWNWALARWSDPIFAAEMMDLQEEHECVILELLLMGWLGQQNWAVTSAGHRRLMTAAAPWLDGVVIPLRNTRRVWSGNEGLASQRLRLQSLELKAEYALAELYFATLAILEPSELVLAEASTVIDNLDTALAVAASPVATQRILNLGVLLSG